MNWQEITNQQLGFKAFKTDKFDFQYFVQQNFCQNKNFIRWKRVLGTDKEIIAYFDKEQKFSKKITDTFSITENANFIYCLKLKD